VTARQFRRFVRAIDVRAEDEVDSLELLSVSQYRGVVPRSEIAHGDPRAEDLSSYKRCWPGDIVLNRMSAYQGALGLAGQQGVVSPDYAVLRSAPSLDPRFLTYLMKSQWFISQMIMRLRGIGAPGSGSVRTPRVNIDDLGDIELPMPTLEEQRRIADYLDDQVTRIDEIALCRRRQLEWLKSHAAGELADLFDVTVHADYLLGLSGESVPLSRLGVRGIAGGTPDSSNSDFWTGPGEGVPWVSISDMVQGGFVDRTEKEVTATGLAAARLHPTPGPTVLFAMYASLGKTTICRAQAVWNQAILGMIPGPNVDANFLLAWFEVIRPILPALARSSTQDNFNAGQVLGLRVPPLTLGAQRAIARHRDSIQSDLKRKSHLLSTSLDLLDELKRSLITAAVTGELSVTTARRWVSV